MNWAKKERWLKNMNKDAKIQREYSIPKQKNTYSSQLHMGYYPEQVIYQAMRQISVSFKRLKLYKASSLTTMKLKPEIKKFKTCGNFSTVLQQTVTANFQHTVNNQTGQRGNKANTSLNKKNQKTLKR